MAYVYAPCAVQYVLLLLENVEHCGGEPEQAANEFAIGFVTNK